VDVSIGGRARRAVDLEANTRELGADLAWLTSILWPEADVRVSPTRVPPGRRVAEAYAVIPNAARPRLLVPFSSPALAERAMRRYDDGMSPFARTLRAAGSRIAGSTLGWSRFPPFVVFYSREPRPDELLTQHLRTLFDRPDVVLAVSFGPPRPNRKPVVQALTLDGETLGFAKVGWNRSTDSLVRTEAAALRRLSRRPPAAFRAAGLIAEDTWMGHALSITAPIPTAAARGAGAARTPPLDAMREIARTGGISFMPLASTAWWRSVMERAGARNQAANVVLRWMQDLHGRRSMWHGSWHGDWAAQNMATVGGRLYVWDWERTLDGVPLGLDAIHFGFQSALRRRRDVGHAAVGALRRGRRALRALGVPGEDDELLMAAYLTELIARFEDGRRDGAVMRSGMPEALLGELRHWVARA
jgi:hypothetical protein